MSSQRVGAFSDGVFAIAITLLVLDLGVPPREELREGGLAAALAHQWPSYLAYLVSFLIIGIIWVNHHTVFDKVRFVDRPVLFANLAVLLTTSVIPFPTHLLAEYLTAGSDAHTAAAVYSATMLAMGLAYSGLWLAITRDAALLHEHIDAATSRAALRRFGPRQCLLPRHHRAGLRQRDRHPGRARRAGDLLLLRPAPHLASGRRDRRACRHARLRMLSPARHGRRGCDPGSECTGPPRRL